MAVLVLVVAAVLVFGTSKPPPRSSSGGGLLGGVALLVVLAAAVGGLPGTAEGGGRAAPGVDGAPGTTADYIAALSPPMRDAVRDLDAAMGGTLRITSGYRSAGYQAELCQRVAGPCAPPGRSLHQRGTAIDVRNWQAAAAALAANPHIPLCQPLPRDDAVHFSLRGAGEC